MNRFRRISPNWCEQAFGAGRRSSCLFRWARKRAGLGDSDKVKVVADDLAWVEAHLRKESAEKSMIEDRRRRAAAAVSR